MIAIGWKGHRAAVGIVAVKLVRASGRGRSGAVGSGGRYGQQQGWDAGMSEYEPERTEKRGTLTFKRSDL